MVESLAESEGYVVSFEAGRGGEKCFKAFNLNNRKREKTVPSQVKELLYR